jgi:hypothetical protein
MGGFKNAPLDRVSPSGKCVVVTLDATAIAQGEDYPCRRILIAAGNTFDVKLALGAVVGAANYIYIPQLNNLDGATGIADGVYLEIPIHNTNELYFAGAENDVIYYMALK